METIYDRGILAEVRHVLCPQIDAASTEILGYLRHELRVPCERLFKAVRHTTHAVELRRDVKLPFFERRLVAGCDDALETVRQGFGSQLGYTLCIDGSLLDIRPPERRRPCPHHCMPSGRTLSHAILAAHEWIAKRSLIVSLVPDFLRSSPVHLHSYGQSPYACHVRQSTLRTQGYGS